MSAAILSLDSPSASATSVAAAMASRGSAERPPACVKGAIPTPIPAPDMYAALQTGVVDAMEGTAEVAYTFKIYDVTKYLSMTRHILLDGSFAISNSLFGKLTKPEQELILKAARDAAVEQRAQHFEREKASLAKLTGEGKMQLNEPDLKPFSDALANLQNEFAAASKGTDVLERIRKL